LAHASLHKNKVSLTQHPELRAEISHKLVCHNGGHHCYHNTHAIIFEFLLQARAALDITGTYFHQQQRIFNDFECLKTAARAAFTSHLSQFYPGS
jgi:hypothetical protein